MGRPSNRAVRRAQILAAFEQVLADHGYAGATIAAVAARAGVAPGLVHHHFDSKQELLAALVTRLVERFRSRAATPGDPDAEPLIAYLDAALRLDERSDVTAARCWVGILAEAMRDPQLFAHLRRLIDGEIGTIQSRSGHALGPGEAGSLLAFVVGALVIGAFAPRETAGFAAPTATELAHVLLRRQTSR